MKHKVIKKSDFYSVSDGKLIRSKKSCPKCGPGVFLAQHQGPAGGAGRVSCGRCGYTEFSKA